MENTNEEALADQHRQNARIGQMKRELSQIEKIMDCERYAY